MSERILRHAQLTQLAREHLRLSLSERLQVVLREDWPACRNGLRVAAQVGARAVPIGPLAAALHGVPDHLGSPRVDLLVTHAQFAEVSAWLTRAGALPVRMERSGGQIRQLWRSGQSELTVRSAGSSFQGLRGAVGRAQPIAVDLGAHCRRIVRLARAEDLVAVAVASPGSEDAAAIQTLLAVRPALIAEDLWVRTRHDHLRPV